MLLSGAHGILIHVANEQTKHEMVSNRGSCSHELRKVQARPVLRCPECSCHLQRWAADFLSVDGGEIMLSPLGYAEIILKVPQ